MERGTSPYLAARAAEIGPAALDAREVAAGEEAGDAGCVEIMGRARRAFTAVCAGLVNTFDPDRIVVGGSIAEAQGERWLAPARAEIARATFRAAGRRAKVVAAELGPDVGLVGALFLVLERLGSDPESVVRPLGTIAART